MSQSQDVVKIDPDGAHYAVYPTGNADSDLKNVRDAIDLVQDNGFIDLKCRTRANVVTSFNFGVFDENTAADAIDANGLGMGVLYLSKNVHLRGEVLQKNSAGKGVEHGTTISGGRQIQWGFDPVKTLATQISASIEGIRFDGFAGGAIRIRATTGHNEISCCSFVNYKKGKTVAIAGTTPKTGAFPIVADAEGKPGRLGGDLLIRYCHFGTPPEAPANDLNNLLHVSHCSLDLEISHNQIDDMCFAGIAVYRNSGKTRIIGNVVNKMSSYKSTIGLDGAGIAVGAAPVLVADPWNYDRIVEILDNQVTVGSENSYGIMVLTFNSPPTEPPVPQDVLVIGNIVSMVGPAAGGASTNAKAALACLGECSNSMWVNNVVTGCAANGIRVSGASMPMKGKLTPVDGPQSNNVFRDNQFAGGSLADPINGVTTQFAPFIAAEAQAYIGPAAADTVLKNNVFGPVTGENHADPHKEKTDLPDPIRAGVVVKGDRSRITTNDFSRSAIPGWWKQGYVWAGAPKQAHVGCIYLSRESEANEVRYRQSDFPEGTYPPEGRQIFDGGQGKAKLANDVAELKDQAVVHTIPELFAWPPSKEPFVGPKPSPVSPEVEIVIERRLVLHHH
jgi:hypothetical protein